MYNVAVSRFVLGALLILPLTGVTFCVAANYLEPSFSAAFSGMRFIRRS